MQRVMIIGTPGSGKSWLARAIGARTGLPVLHMDRLFWQPGWQARSADGKAALHADWVAGPAWVWEGNYAKGYAERLDRADMLIWLDLPIWRRFWRVLRRTLRHYGDTRPDLPENCPERVSLDFYRYIFESRARNRARMRALYDTAPPHVARHHLAGRAQVAAFLSTLPDQTGDRP